MSEKRLKNNEVFQAGSSEKEHQAEARQDKLEVSETSTKQAEQLAFAREKALKESSEKNQLLDKLDIAQEKAEDDLSRRPIGKELKKLTFEKEIRHVRRKLPKVDRLGSRIIHQPAVKSISEVSSKTITRPSGLLGGGVTAFLGTSIYLYLTRDIGLKYNYSIFLFLLIAGFVLGVLIEAAFRLAKGKRSI